MALTWSHAFAIRLGSDIAPFSEPTRRVATILVGSLRAMAWSYLGALQAGAGAKLDGVLWNTG